MSPDSSQHEEQASLFNILALLEPTVYPYAVKHCELIETHISWVILTGDYAYKIKKPVDLGFLDFSTLEKRHYYCLEELRLNRRLAADIYLDVVAITGTLEQPTVNERQSKQTTVIEYAVKMRQFPQQAQLDRMLLAGKLLPQHIDVFAQRIAKFHQQIDTATSTTQYGDIKQVCQPVQENIEQIRRYINNEKCQSMLADLEQWSNSEYKKLELVFKQRKQAGFIRECHGDMHLRNLAWIDNEAVLFDCIEFNPELRWIDVISDIAFLVMDLQDRQQPQLAQRFLNQYLEATGDYAGVAVLPYYLFYRALVRAKVDAIRAAQSDISSDEKVEAEKDMAGYLDLAYRYTQKIKPKLIITRGLSGSGKTSISGMLLEQFPAIRIRSDVERKRLFGLKAEQSAKTTSGEGIYAADATERTYNKLAELASNIIDAGFNVIVDATFIKPEQRTPFRLLAKAKKVSFLILEFTASAETLRQRIINRHGDASDADIQVLEYQLQHWHSLFIDEKDNLIEVNTEQEPDMGKLIDDINSRCFDFIENTASDFE